jgi:sec-independent protein translocase protein TatA
MNSSIEENSSNYKISRIIEGPISSEREKLEIIAKSLSINFADKSDEELRLIITEKMKNNK